MQPQRSAEFLIRRARREEIPRIREVLDEADREHMARLHEEVVEEWKQSIEEALASPDGELIVAVSGGTIVGVVQFYSDASASTAERWPAGSSCIRLLGVLPAHRRRGIGAALLKECIARARKYGTQIIYPLLRAWHRYNMLISHDFLVARTLQTT